MGQGYPSKRKEMTDWGINCRKSSDRQKAYEGSSSLPLRSVGEVASVIRQGHGDR